MNRRSFIAALAAMPAAVKAWAMGAPTGPTLPGKPDGWHRAAVVVKDGRLSLSIDGVDLLSFRHGNDTCTSALYRFDGSDVALDSFAVVDHDESSSGFTLFPGWESTYCAPDKARRP